MKKLSLFIFVALLGFTSHGAFAVTRDEADETFRARGPEGDSLQNASKAASMYDSLYNEAVASGQPVEDQAQLLNLESSALYYYADHVSNNEDKKSGHSKGMEVADKAAKLLHKEGQPTEPKEQDYKTTLATAFYWYSANMGKWGLANGILNSLRQWPDLRKRTEYIYTLGENDVESYGANRILGRAYYSLPFPMGDNTKALELLEEANERTLDSEGEISSHSTNVIYYADILIAKGRKDVAKNILSKLVNKGRSEDSLKEYNEERIPETKEDIEIAKKMLSRL